MVHVNIRRASKVHFSIKHPIKLKILLSALQNIMFPIAIRIHFVHNSDSGYFPKVAAAEVLGIVFRANPILKQYQSRNR